ncbi:MAG: hypothetical protein P8M05_04645 [Flavobacteriales bacterium]|nr:hypothetical protein [Flavobacteriales bacterium]
MSNKLILLTATFMFAACQSKTETNTHKEEKVQLTHYQKAQNKFENEFGHILEYQNITLSSQGPSSGNYDIYIPQNYIKHVASANNIAFFEEETGFSIVVSDIHERDSNTQLEWLENIQQIVSETYQISLNKSDWQKESGPFEAVFYYSNIKVPLNLWAIKNDKKVLMIQVSKSSELTVNDINFARFVINNIVLENVQD